MRPSDQHTKYCVRFVYFLFFLFYVFRIGIPNLALLRTPCWDTHSGGSAGPRRVKDSRWSESEMEAIGISVGPDGRGRQALLGEALCASMHTSGSEDA